MRVLLPIPPVRGDDGLTINRSATRSRVIESTLNLLQVFHLESFEGTYWDLSVAVVLRSK